MQQSSAASDSEPVAIHVDEEECDMADRLKDGT